MGYLAWVKFADFVLFVRNFYKIWNYFLFRYCIFRLYIVYQTGSFYFCLV